MTSPYTLSSFTLTLEQSARIAGMNDACREHEIGLLIYAHLYNERCRALHCAILHHHADIALQRHWQEHREAYARVAKPVAAETLRKAAA